MLEPHESDIGDFRKPRKKQDLFCFATNYLEKLCPPRGCLRPRGTLGEGVEKLLLGLLQPLGRAAVAR